MTERDIPPVDCLSLSFLEHLQYDFHSDPENVSRAWRRVFESMNGSPEHPARPPRDSIRTPPSLFRTRRTSRHAHAPQKDETVAELQDRVDQMVRAYRVRGHMIAHLDPLDRPRDPVPELEPSHYDINERDLKRRVSSRTLVGGDHRTIEDIRKQLRSTYCRSIGVQFMHIDDLDARHWLQERMEGSWNRIDLPPDRQRRILALLTRAVVMEEFVQKKYIGAKSFSLEGCESLIPLLDVLIDKAADDGVDRIVLGMAHRGRLNVLVNILGKRPVDVFREFEDADPNAQRGGGDVSYHLGYSGDCSASSGAIVHVSLCFNPSHLEFVNPVVLGRVRAHHERARVSGDTPALGVLIHGDASFAGEGIVQETLNLSELDAYSTGGTVHIIVNNQLGFTTPPRQGRSNIYATAVAKSLQAPIFHVNGEDPEAVAQVITLAMDFRREFRRDVFVDMYGYRRHGHNEIDEPSFTQPELYRKIADRCSVRDGYLEHLREHGGVSDDEADATADRCREELKRGFEAARGEEHVTEPPNPPSRWDAYRGGDDRSAPDVPTGVETERLKDLLSSLAGVPDDFHLHRKLERATERRREMAAEKRPIDWSAAEQLAFASLAAEGVPVRLSGQDSERGTFSQRHAILHDTENGATYESHNHVAEAQAPVAIHNSPLSEGGVLGFEYGYSLDTPAGLTVWEAQFGDFVNAAQVYIDQFIASAQDKWDRLSGITLLLPHGWEGQGPEHSSARLERFLTLAAEENMQIVCPTTPAQYFHVLRRQVLRPWRRPLVVLTPKSLLRHKRVVSDLGDLAEGSFRRILPDAEMDPAEATRVLLCSGKIYYELLAHREELERPDVPIVRIEQFYPLDNRFLERALGSVADGTPAIWVQEEPENMGAWRYWKCRFGDSLLERFPLRAVCRPASASPASGSKSSHDQGQSELVHRAFADLEERAQRRSAHR